MHAPWPGNVFALRSTSLLYFTSDGTFFSDINIMKNIKSLIPRRPQFKPVRWASNTADLHNNMLSVFRRQIATFCQNPACVRRSAASEIPKTMSIYQNTTLDANNSRLPLSSEYCHRFQDEEYFMISFSVTLASIILEVFCCPFVVLMNALAIAAVKRTRRLQSASNILLASLAGTDLLTGTTIFPASIAGEIFAITGGSVTTYCTLVKNIVSLLRFLSVLTSLFHLGVISVDRYIAIRPSLQYYNIVTKFRLVIAITFQSWCLAGVFTIIKLSVDTSLPVFVLQGLAFTCVLILVYCHVSVYLVTRRHERQIRTEQIPTGEDTEQFLREQKGWKTTGNCVRQRTLS